MKKTVKKKLTLSRETLLALQGDWLSQILGGTTANTDTCTGTCHDREISRCNCTKNACLAPE
ncbi:MAG TPA: class I lanthipeptide [Thermoanaerobaculia bacterium]|nr:class I lanthipeptide [Thermoanaerobaculia bacterium]